MLIPRILGVILLVAGVAAVIYGGLIYSPETAEIAIGSLEFTIQDRDQPKTPILLGLIAIIGGTVLLLMPPSRRQRAA